MFNRYDPYPSRVGAEEKILPRVDPVIHYGEPQHSDYKLSPQQLKEYEEQGILTLPGYCDDWVQKLRQESGRLKEKMQGKDELYTEPDNGELRTIFKPHAYSSLIADVVRSPRILGLVKQILGPSVYVTQSRINQKPAFRGRSFAWHSDFETWHVEDGMPRMRAVTAWIMLTDNHEYNGPLYVIPGSHKKYISCEGTTAKENYRHSLKRQVAGVPNEKTMDSVLRDHEIKGVYGKAGTLVLHECNLLHASPDNLSGDPRALLMMIYNSAENELQKPFSQQQPRPDYLAERKPVIL